MYLYVISAIGMHMQMFHVSAVSTTPDEQKKHQLYTHLWNFDMRYPPMSNMWLAQTLHHI